jgi:hypothetical protein
VSRDRVGELIELGLDRQAAELAVRDALEADAEEADASSAPVDQPEVLIAPAGGMPDDTDVMRS